MQGTQSEEPGQVMTDFVKQFYSSSAYIPSLILLQYPIMDKTVIESWARQKKRRRGRYTIPGQGQ